MDEAEVVCNLLKAAGAVDGAGAVGRYGLTVDGRRWGQKKKWADFAVGFQVVQVCSLVSLALVRSLEGSVGR